MKKSLILFSVCLIAAPGLAQDSHYKEGGTAADSTTGPTASPTAPSDAADPSAPKVDHRDATTADKDAMSQEDKSAATYRRKTLLYFAPETVWDKPGWHVVRWFKFYGQRFPGGAWTLEAMNQMVGKAIGRATRMVRFDFVDMPYGVPPNQKNLKAFSDYMKASKMDKAKAEADFNVKYKEFDIKGRDLERVMNSAFFYQPTLTGAGVKRVLVCDIPDSKRPRNDGNNQRIHVRQSFDSWRSERASNLEGLIKNGRVSRQSEVRVPGETDWMKAGQWLQKRKRERDRFQAQQAKYEAWQKNPQKGQRAPSKPQYPARCMFPSSEDNKSARKPYHPEWQCRLSAKFDFHHLRHAPPYKKHFAKLRASGNSQQRRLRDACRGAASSIGGSVQQQMRGLEPFRLLAPINSKVGDRLGFGLGSREGIRVDQGFYVAEYNTAMKRQKIGYSRVRKVANNKPGKDGMKRDVSSEAELIAGRGDLGHQMLEDHRDNGGNFIIAGGMGVTFGFAKSLGFAFNSSALSELWFVGDFGTNYSADLGDFAGFGALGLKKRWHSGALGFGAQFDVGVNAGSEDLHPGTHIFADYFLGSGWAGIHGRAGLQAGLPTLMGGLIFNY
ncbi:MAG: hypothetical protein CMH55_02575 [Myxococcales bacterium]|nr:hypothetical protein [Myxococcales bacterium]